MRFFLCGKTIFVTIFTFSIFALGCTIPVKNTAPPPDFLAQKNSIGIITITTTNSYTGTGELYWIGSWGLLDAAIIENSDFNKQITERLRKEEIGPIVKKYYLDLFKEAFTLEGFKVKTVDKPYDHKNLPIIEKGDMKKSGAVLFHSTNFDIKYITAELHTDYLIVLEIHRFGVARSYRGFIPQGRPCAWAALRFTLIETTPNKPIAEHFSNYCLESEEWDEPPEYNKLMKVLLTAFTKSVNDAFIGFFRRAP